MMAKKGNYKMILTNIWMSSYLTSDLLYSTPGELQDPHQKNILLFFNYSSSSAFLVLFMNIGTFSILLINILFHFTLINILCQRPWAAIALYTTSSVFVYISCHPKIIVPPTQRYRL